jgi:hypothetical protein
VSNDTWRKSCLRKGRFYEPPKQVSSSSLPHAVVEFLNGKDFERKASQALHLSTVDEDGWPHGAMLSAGEILALDASEVAMLLYQSSNTSKNSRVMGD